MSLNQKVANFIHFLKDLSQLRHKPIYSYKNYDETLWLQHLPVGAECQNAFQHNIEAWLFVKKPTYPPLPAIPKALSDWINIHPDKKTISVHEKVIKETYETKTTGQELFADHPSIQADIDNFINNVWKPYVAEFNRVHKIQLLYDKLYKIYQDLYLHSEPLELVVSVGLLQWQKTNQNKVERHVLTSEVDLKFDKERAEMTIVPSTKGITFTYEEDMLYVKDRLTGKDHQEIKALLSAFFEENCLQDQLSVILRNIANMLDSHSTYLETIEIPSFSTLGPVISLSPAFIVRKKSQKSFHHACERAIEQLSTLTESAIPVNLTNMFISDPQEFVSMHDEATAEIQPSEPYYFPLPANEQQTKIIESIQNENSVLVQGPPGTGKTHTIANLTAHLLATGKRVLITSQTPKALSVLKSKLPKQLQSLSVSLLGGDSVAMKDLEKVVQTISINQEQFDVTKMMKTIEKKLQTLKKLMKKKKELKAELFSIRQAETDVHHFHPPYKGTAQQIAQQIKADEAKYHWYTTTLSGHEDASFWKLEKKRVTRYLELKNLNMNKPANFAHYHYPKINQAVYFDYLPKIIKEEAQFAEKARVLREEADEQLLHYIQSLTTEEQQKLKCFQSEYRSLVKPLLFRTYPTIKKVITDIFHNRGETWLIIAKQLDTYLVKMKQMNKQLDANLMEVHDIPTPSLKKMAEDLFNHVANGGKMGNFLLKPKIVRQYEAFLQKITYNHLPIKTEEAVEKLYYYAQAKFAFENMNQLPIPELHGLEFANELSLIEYRQFAEQLHMALKIYQWRTKLLQQFTYFTADTYNELVHQALTTCLDYQEIQDTLQRKTAEINQAITILDTLKVKNIHPLYFDIITALKNRDVAFLPEIKSNYNFFQKVKEHEDIVRLLANKIRITGPLLMQNLDTTFSDSIWKERLNNWEQAFYWKKTKQWLANFSKRDETTLSDQIEQTEQKITDLITKVGAMKAWVNMLRAMTAEQAKHLKAWARSIKSIGKGTGKNAHRHVANAQKHMEKCKDAIPAWIMPLHRVFENFEIKPNLFDIVIVDEASQSWHDALLLNYLAKKMIIVGDDQQISPNIIGIHGADIEKLSQKYLKTIDFAFADTFNLNNSFFDISYIMFKKIITLREHFRCMPEIIGFSNQIAYSNHPLIPLRQYEASRLTPIKSVYLPHGVRKGSNAQSTYNEIEAEAIVKQISTCLNDRRYDGKTFGVISLLGNYQAKLIQNMLLEQIGAEVMEDRKIICGDAYAFQGDERDIMFLSMVAAKGNNRITALTNEAARQRFNVAVSRAKDQLWVIHSISINDINNPECIRYQLLTYIADPFKEEAEANRNICKNQFERDVFDQIHERGYHVIPQFEVAGYRLDFIIQGEHARLAIECDGDDWHISQEERERDFLYERMLQRAGWTFYRILGSRYYQDPENALQSLWRKLDEMNIRPRQEWDDYLQTNAKQTSESRKKFVNV